ncbi:MAG: Cof-type HAD-IIB family hydrolase [Actinomycetales bacterium]|nr:Cof-type HAD-IIB family hydrolase [Actinomycetales bacterium]
MTQLFATDLDGTLLNSFGEVSTENLAAIDLAKNSGLSVVFVTGRPPRWMEEIKQITAHHGHAICANGALVLDVETGEIIRADFLNPELAAEVVTALRQLDSEMAFAVEVIDEQAPFLMDDNYRPRWETPRQVPRVSVAEMLARENVVKLLARPRMLTDLDAIGFVAAAQSAVGHLVDLTNSNSADVMLEVSPAGVNKGTALARFASDLSIPQASVAAVGDMPNDIEMIKWAGLGAAVDNAHEQVKAVADLHLPSNDEHAVAVFINQILHS